MVKAMDLVDEEDVARLEAGQDGGQVAGFFDNRPRGDPDVGAHLVGDDIGQGGLAQPRKAVEKHMVQGLAAVLGGLDGDLQIALELVLADVLGQRPGADGQISGLRPGRPGR